MHSKVLTYQKFQTWKSATACTGAKNLETGIPFSRTSDISKLPITRTESSFSSLSPELYPQFLELGDFPRWSSFPLEFTKISIPVQNNSSVLGVAIAV